MEPIRYVFPLFLFNQMLSAFLRNDKNPGLATLGVLSGGLFNVFGDYFFVFTCDMGIYGAGLATAIGSGISFLVMMTHFVRSKNTFFGVFWTTLSMACPNLYMAGLRQRTLLDGNDLFIEFKGALTEQYVCQQLKTIEDLGVYYYTNDRGSCEIDFIVDTGEQVIPVEVKAETNLRAKSLKTYQEKFTPKIAVRTSMADFKKEDRLVNLPLYAVEH